MTSSRLIQALELSTTAASSSEERRKSPLRCRAPTSGIWVLVRHGYAAYRFIDDLFVEQTNRAELANGKQSYLDLSVSYQQGGATFSVFGRNLTDEDALAHGLNVSGLWSYATPVAPRTWGVEVVHDFGTNALGQRGVNIRGAYFGRLDILSRRGTSALKTESKYSQEL